MRDLLRSGVAQLEYSKRDWYTQRWFNGAKYMRVVRATRCTGAQAAGEWAGGEGEVGRGQREPRVVTHRVGRRQR